MSDKDLRSHALGETVNTEEYMIDGATYKVKALTRKQHNRLQRQTHDGDPDRGIPEGEYSDCEWQELAIVECVLYPDGHDEAGEQIFDIADLNEIKNAPANGRVADLEKAILHVNGFFVKDEDTENDSKKNQADSNE